MKLKNAKEAIAMVRNNLAESKCDCLSIIEKDLEEYNFY